VRKTLFRFDEANVSFDGCEREACATPAHPGLALISRKGVLTMKVQDIMTKSVRFCRVDTDLAVASRMMWDHDCGVLPVVDYRQRVVGMITDRDICIAVGTRRQVAFRVRVGDLITGKLYGCNPDDAVKGALGIMKKARVRRLPVTDDDGILQGIISISDVVLCAEKATSAERPVISYQDVVEAYSAICEPAGTVTVEMSDVRFATA
jgi:CBS domain-containing protein